LDQAVTAEELSQVQEAVKDIFVAPQLRRYIVDLTHQTREHPEVYLGASPRGSLALHRGAQARSALDGRDYVIPDDVKALARPMLAHRLIISPSARIKNVDATAIVDELLSSVPVPGARVRSARH